LKFNSYKDEENIPKLEQLPSNMIDLINLQLSLEIPMKSAELAQKKKRVAKEKSFFFLKKKKKYCFYR
jgi:hypothetical protein